MKVLHIYNSHRGNGGSDNAWAATIRVSRAAGIDVEILSRDSKEIAPTPRGRISAALAGIYAPEAIASTRAAIERIRPDIVHTHELYPLISPWVIRAVDRMGIPVVHSHYDFRLTCPIATHYRRGQVCHLCKGGREHNAVLHNCRDSLGESVAYAARNAVARRFSLYTRHVREHLVLSNFHQDWLARDVGIPPGRTTIVPCQIEVPSTAANAAEGGYIAYAGRFVAEKGVELLIAAARRTGLPVYLAGDAASHPAIREGDPVTCVIARSREELAAFYRGARMLVVPSLWYETFCIVGAEAMSHGIPVLASRIGALNDLVQDGVTGRHFAMGSVEELADAMQQLWNDPEACRTMGQAAREYVIRSYTTDVHIARLKEAYARALAKPA